MGDLSAPPEEEGSSNQKYPNVPDEYVKKKRQEHLFRNISFGAAWCFSLICLVFAFYLTCKLTSYYLDAQHENYQEILKVAGNYKDEPRPTINKELELLIKNQKAIPYYVLIIALFTAVSVTLGIAALRFSFNVDEGNKSTVTSPSLNAVADLIKELISVFQKK